MFQLVSMNTLEFSLINFIGSLIPNYLVNSLSAQGLSKSQIKTIVLSSMSSFYDDLKSLIWLPRCDRTIERQLQMGLTHKTKRVKYKHRNRSNSSTSAPHTSITKTSPTRWTGWITNTLQYGTKWLDFRKLLEYVQFPVAIRVKYRCFAW